MAGAASASAIDVDWYVAGSFPANSHQASGSYSGFRASGLVVDSTSHLAHAGAHYPGGWTLYANYATGMGHACHTYDGTSTFGALIENPHSVNLDPSTAILRWNNPLVAC